MARDLLKVMIRCVSAIAMCCLDLEIMLASSPAKIANNQVVVNLKDLGVRFPHLRLKSS